MLYKKMATRQMSPAKSQTGSRSLTRALALAFNEWLLMLMLFANSIFSYVIAKFADYSELQSPCLMCSRLDHILGRTKHLKKSHWDMVCSKHKSEISSLVYCHAHGKLVDVRGMCETCLFSFATTNKSNAETYRLLVGKLGEDSSFGSKSDGSKNPRYCTCCHQLWKPQTASTDQVAKPATLPKIRLVSDVRTGKLSTPKKSVRFNQLPHVGYTELKIHSDTESEAVFSEDEGVVVKEEDHMFQNVDLETPPVITLPYDLATDKLLNLDFPLQPLVARNDREEVHLQEIDLRTNSFFPDLIPVDGMPEISENVLKEEEIISLDNLFLTSRAMEHPAAISREKEELIPLQDVSLTPEFKEVPADALMKETELIPVNGVPETSEKVLKEEEVVSLDNLFLTSRAMEHSEVVSKVKEDLIHLQDISVTPDFKEKSENALMEETELICLNDVTSTSDAAESAEDHVLMKETVLNEKEDLIHLQDTSLTPNIKGNPAYALMEDTELICLNDVTSTSDAAETTEDVLMEETVLEEKEDLIHLQDTSLLPDFKDNPPYALMETELIPLNDVTSTSSDPAETPEDVLKGIELMSPHDIFRDKTPESFTTNETLVETSTERGTNQADINSLESEYVVVSPSTSTKSMPENSTEKCESENKGMKETSPTVSSVSEMASHTEAALESESASFNSMSVAAETNLGSGESWMQGGELLNLADAYNIIVHNEGSKDSNGVAQIEQWMKKDTSRVSEDLKALLTQISASRGIEFLSPRDISPKISSDQETKNLDHDMQLLIQRRMLERNESNLSLEGVSVSEIEGESESDRLKRQVDHDRKLLTGLYKELEEERSASAVATNQAMAMITRLQEEKALFQMEALQNLRMMEEQAEYDMEAIQKLNDLLVEREKLIQDLEAEIDYFRDQTPQKKKLDNVTGIDSPSEGMSNKIQNCLSGFNEERLYIASCLEKIENRVQTDVNGEAHVDNLPTQESVSELHERVERLKGDMYFLEHVVNSLGHGNEGVQFVKEIASHLQTLRSLSMKRKDHTEC
ncbi:myosin-binding protein 1 [Eutrema salsugineum]|uniref:myosin-binding protein 1 n=1 Tax=Eutrema salsugineum TaxID=72664 RepID=UPI000CED7EA6|nr:myosin-binding protein 1 [Eutrema salsugineum]XP_024008155.1 myosin-binding protein 1 [Eutrema salsugineum]